MRAVERAYKPGNIPLVEIFVLAAAYFGAGSFGLSLASVNRSATAVWPGTGLSIAALLFFGWRLWPGVFLGAFLVNILTQGGVVTTLGIASGNTLEALMGAWLVQRFAGGSKAFEKTRNIFRFVWLAAMLSTLVSASIGVTSLCLGGFAHGKDFSAIWLTWWLGDMVSAVIIAPLLLLWATKPFPRLAWRRILEAGALLLLVFWIGQTVFLGHAPFHGHNYPLEYLAIPPLLWASFRFGEHGAVSTAFIMSGIALWGTRHNLGPFVGYDQNEALLLLQTFMGTITMTGLVLASILAGRHRAELRLKAQYALSQALADAATLKEATPRIFQALSEPDGWQFGSIWIVDG